MMEAMHLEVKEIVGGMRRQLTDISTFIFEHPELGDEEYQSCAYLVDALTEAGFAVTCPYKNMPTAFRAELDCGPGPSIGFLAEYDALPGYGPEKQNAHACGHNWIAATTVGAGLVLAKLRGKFSGKIVVFGTPAEETAGRKIDMAEGGAFDDMDAVFQLHLAEETGLNARALAMNSAEFEFIGKAAHAAAYPQDGINALDAVIQTFNGVASLRQQLTDDVRIHGIITEGGRAPNIIPDHCKCLFYVRAARRDVFLSAFEKVKNCARGAALATGCKLNVNMAENQYDDLRVNPVLAEVMARHMELSGFEPLTLRQESPGSTDIGNVSYRCPVMYGNVGIADGKALVHEEAFIPFADSSEAHRRIEQTVESFACCALELSAHPETALKARLAFNDMPME